MQISKLSPVSFNGQYRNVKVRKVGKYEYRARVLDSQNDSGRCVVPEEAVYRAIKSSNNYKKDSEIERCKNVVIKRGQKETSASVYFSDENEKVNTEQIRPYVNFIVYAPGSGNS